MSSTIAGPVTKGPTELRDLRHRYARVRAQTEALAESLGAEDQTAQSMPDASPTKWHRAHTSWFFETFVLTRHARGYQVYDDAYATLFNSYYQSVNRPYPRPQRGLVTRPTVAEVSAYRAHVDVAMDALLAGPCAPEIESLVELGLHHEQQHQELLLTDLLHLFSHNPTDPAYAAAPARRPAVEPPAEMSYERHPGGLVELGHRGAGFAFDNEGPRHKVYLTPFEIGARLVTAGEYLEFIEAGGYAEPRLWLDAGFHFVRSQRIEAPLHWRREADGSHSQFTLHGRRAVDPSAPVMHLSYFEADAYARFAGARLPSEAEWECVAPEPPEARMGAPLGALLPQGEAGGFYASVWQWTRSDYAPYPRFEADPSAVGEYNGKFMSGQMVLRGSSCFTAAGHARKTYRNFFPPEARWQCTGLRLARDTKD